MSKGIRLAGMLSLFICAAARAQTAPAPELPPLSMSDIARPDFVPPAARAVAQAPAVPGLLPEGARLTALRDIVLPAGADSVVFHHGKILSNAEAEAVTGDNDEPLEGESFCALSVRAERTREDGPPQVLLRAGESVAVRGDEEASRFAMGHVLRAAEHPLIREFGCFALVKEPKPFVTPALMEEHIRGILRAAAPSLPGAN